MSDTSSNVGHSTRPEVGVGDVVFIATDAGVWDYGGASPADGALVLGVHRDGVTARFSGLFEPDHDAGETEPVQGWTEWSFDYDDLIAVASGVDHPLAAVGHKDPLGESAS